MGDIFFWTILVNWRFTFEGNVDYFLFLFLVLFFIIDGIVGWRGGFFILFGDLFGRRWGRPRGRWFCFTGSSCRFSGLDFRRRRGRIFGLRFGCLLGCLLFWRHLIEILRIWIFRQNSKFFINDPELLIYSGDF